MPRRSGPIPKALTRPTAPGQPRHRKARPHSSSRCPRPASRQKNASKPNGSISTAIKSRRHDPERDDRYGEEAGEHARAQCDGAW